MGTAYLPSPFDKMAYYFFALTVPTSKFMFFLDVQPEEAEKRIRQTRSQFEMFESLQQLKNIRQKALALALAGKWRIIDAGNPVTEVQNEIIQAL
jgi:thymidylate kinase